MQFTTLALTAATCAMAAPAPQSAGQPNLNPDLVIFSVTTQQPGGKLQANGWGAMKKGIYTGVSPQEDASCTDGEFHQFATFVLNKADKGTLSLYTDGKPWQELFVDRSGMGQGIMQYTTGAEPAPRNAERTGWAIDENRVLSFAGSDKFLACPGGPNNSFRVLPYVGISSPAGYSNCTEITALAQISSPDPKAADPQYPVMCYYSTE